VPLIQAGRGADGSPHESLILAESGESVDPAKMGAPALSRFDSANEAMID
jgi:hypothetical protein